MFEIKTRIIMKLYLSWTKRKFVISFCRCRRLQRRNLGESDCSCSSLTQLVTWGINEGKNGSYIEGRSFRKIHGYGRLCRYYGTMRLMDGMGRLGEKTRSRLTMFEKRMFIHFTRIRKSPKRRLMKLASTFPPKVHEIKQWIKKFCKNHYCVLFWELRRTTNLVLWP